MKRVACWKSDDVYVVINPDADALDDAIFRSIHTDFPVQISSGRTSGTRAVSAAEFLELVLKPKDHVIVPVVGDSGTGKSHLVRWLDLQLRGSSDVREVIYVPKAQTNLRDIVHSLVQRLPPKEQQPYLTALNATGGATLSSEAQRTAILNQIQLALVNDQGGISINVDTELEEYALIGLRAMFSDPHIRKTMLLNKGFAAELASHVFDKPENYHPAEERREFREKDLPLQVGDLLKTAQETRDFLSWLMSATESERATVIGIVNRHVDWAIGNCLNLSGDRLITLMLELRRQFRSSGHELVLLIEDFARLQGLDRALLQSILEQQSDLCVLRTVFASTTGFYQSLQSTIQTRLTFVVDMDINAEKERPDLGLFVSRYMNAVRWGSNALQQQWIAVQEGTVDFRVPSKCDECLYKGECHSNFGEVDGVGLYPFTSTAIEIMAERSRREHQATFNPREFLKLVVKPVALAANDLAEGNFPPPKILTGLGGKTMPAAQQSRLKREDPQHWERRLGVLELWTGSQEAANFPDWLHTAFDLAQLTGATTVVEKGTTPAKNDTPEKFKEVTPTDDRLMEIQKWYDGRLKLSSTTAQEMRNGVFDALEKFIDWDNIGLARAIVFGRKGGLFKPGQISFKEQATQQSPTAIRLEIPLNWQDDTERLRTTLALQGILEAKSRGNWSFADGLNKLACLLECLHSWSTILIEQCRSGDGSTAGPTIPYLAFEMRATLQSIASQSDPMTTDQEVLKAVFCELPSDPPDFMTGDLNELINGLRQVDGQVLEAIRGRFTAMKGGVPGDFLDAATLFPLAASLRRRRFLPADRVGSTGADRKDLIDPVRGIAKKMAEGFENALIREAKEREVLKQRIVESFGERTPKESVVHYLQQTLDVSAELDVQGKGLVLAAKSRFEQTNYAELMTSLRAADSSKLDVRQIRSGVGQDARTVSETIDTANSFLDRVAKEIAGRLETAGVDTDEKGRTIVVLKAELNSIGQLLGRYQDGNAG